MVIKMGEVFELMTSNDLDGTFDDSLHARRGNDDLDAAFGNVLLRLRRLTLGRDVQIDDDMIETAELFSRWRRPRR